MTDRLDLPRRYREELEALLRKHVPDAKVWAHGSRVNGRSHDGSDLDLVLRSTTLEPLGYEYVELVEALDCVVVQNGIGTDQTAELSEWPNVPLDEITTLTLSSVDKKSKANEKSVRLCNYMDVYSNNFISSNLDFMAATATEREVANCSLFAGDVVITKDSEKHDDIGVPALVREDLPGHALAEQRDALLPQLVSGQLRIRHV